MNIFLVTSPLQLINAIEAKNKFNCKNNILILRNEKTNLGKTQIDSILSLDNWDCVIRLGRRSKLFSIIFTILKCKLIIKRREINNFFFADYSAWRTNVLLENLPAKNEIMIDDGLLTVREYNSKIKPKKCIGSLKKYNFLLGLLNLKPPRDIHPSNNLKIFTLFEISDERVIKNGLSSFSGKENNLSIENKDFIVFIGQARTNEAGMRVNDYTTLISKVTKNRKTYYFPHRNEDSSLEKDISRLKHVIYCHNSLPIEAELITKKITPQEIYGIGSTALVTLSHIFPKSKIYNINVEISLYINEAYGNTFKEVNHSIPLKTLNYPKDLK
ncbi:hypothetical protein CRN45_12975 [Vibrio vulnificus]|uniref:polysialyltransferase family glycosyltransferase n=2 Tax=Vibrio vulnificus TaxID=672 RepID=UPI0004B8556A|nr:polysialyltransferase family glycosyltransferase [Vibrio vulnificus]POC49413.1 hypothetical protein CRN45_12975 [Vibrio vulnificus]